MMKRWVVFVSLLFVLVTLLVMPVKADECAGKTGEPLYTCLGQQIDQLQKDLEASRAATAPLEEEVERLEGQIAGIQAQITKAKNDQANIEASIEDREEALAKQYVVWSEKMRDYYKTIRSGGGLAEFLALVGEDNFQRSVGYRQVAADQDRLLILSLSEEIVGLEKDKEDLIASQKRLAGLQVSLDNQAEFFRGEVSGAKAYQSSLEGKIASLSALQQSILSSKAETFSTTVGDVPLADDPNSRPDYNPGFSPAFAAFSFGAPHFKGMSQYGAFGRAKEGQSVEDILKAYYGGVEINKGYSTAINITVQGYGTVDIETYTKRIYEMPGSWGDEGGMEALKAQAVAARSYALAYTNNGAGSICATESCQVYKPANKGGNWDAAVDATRGWVLTSGGQPFSAWYASTSGGYQESYTAQGHTTPGFWDTKSGRSGWTSQAYEKIAGSPWFYKGWYKSRSGDSCGRSHPWLTGEEMADILNAWVVLYKHGQSDEKVTPNGPCWSGNPYSTGELRDKANSLSVGYSSVGGVSVVYRDDGMTDSVTFSTDKGSVTINGIEFKKAFNLRAPGRIALKSGLFNMESK